VLDVNISFSFYSFFRSVSFRENPVAHPNATLDALSALASHSACSLLLRIPVVVAPRRLVALPRRLCALVDVLQAFFSGRVEVSNNMISLTLHRMATMQKIKAQFSNISSPVQQSSSRAAPGRRHRLCGLVF
jgi:hypothetical protein